MRSESAGRRSGGPVPVWRGGSTGDPGRLGANLSDASGLVRAGVRGMGGPVAGARLLGQCGRAGQHRPPVGEHHPQGSHVRASARGGADGDPEQGPPPCPVHAHAGTARIPGAGARGRAARRGARGAAEGLPDVA